jgi:N-acetylglutamate synthase-like GNAT family acetyltransferase
MEVVRPQTDAQWASYYDLRWRVLRAPWGQPPASARDELEDVAEHAMICDDQGLAIAVGRLHCNSADEAQIRSMAVTPAHRGRGLGRLIVEYLEQAARERGVKTVMLNAREGAVGFYDKLGYEAVSPGPTLFGVIPHVKMQKAL